MQDFPFYAVPALLCSLYNLLGNVLQLNAMLGAVLNNAASSPHKENTSKPHQLSPATQILSPSAGSSCQGWLRAVPGRQQSPCPSTAPWAAGPCSAGQPWAPLAALHKRESENVLTESAGIGMLQL